LLSFEEIAGTMRTDIAKALDIEVPIFAFSHCRDVVAAVTKAGGLGVLGAAWMTPDELEMSIEWLEKEVDGKPFGVDLVFPGTGGDEKSPAEYLADIPESHLAFVTKLLDDAGLSDVSREDREAFMAQNAEKMTMTNEKSARQLEITLAHPSVRLVVGALGVTPEWVVSEAHAKGVKVGALVGSARHAAKQVEAGVDLLVAQGTEAGGSVGSVASMVLWPQVVEAAQGVPVLAAGGVSRGSHILAALSLGCQGVWLGSLWLGTAEGELSLEMRDKLFSASSEDAVIAKVMTGKQGRMLRTEYVKAWQDSDAPSPLTWPMQSILNGYSYKRSERARDLDYWTYAVGQVVGDMKHNTTVKSEMTRLLDEYVEALEDLESRTSME
jgi:NAD(P)H-dependent flavin oxidoreductase YrpB (nitropropane dioxygenase family)